jgi:hypothetical protein
MSTLREKRVRGEDRRGPFLDIIYQSKLLWRILISGDEEAQLGGRIEPNL